VVSEPDHGSSNYDSFNRPDLVGRSVIDTATLRTSIASSTAFERTVTGRAGVFNVNNEDTTTR